SGDRAEHDEFLLHGAGAPLLLFFWGRWEMFRLSTASSSAGPVAEGVDHHRAGDDDADHDLLPERRHVQQVQTVAQHADDERADEGSDHGADAAGEAGAADDDGRDDVEFESGP